MISVCYLFTVRMNMHALVLANTCAHARIVAHMELSVHYRNGIFSHAYTVHLHTPDGYTCIWHTIKLSGTDRWYTHSQTL